MTAWVAKLVQGFGHAFHGIGWALKTQCHLRIHLLATVSVIMLGVIRQIVTWEWCVIFLCIGLVWMAELFNTALEVLCDRVTREKDESIKRVKDVAAGAVLVTAMISIAVAILIFL